VRPVRDPRWLNSPVRRLARVVIVFLMSVVVFGILIGAGAWLLRSSMIHQATVTTPKI
jgi:hypothetical protein